MVLQPSVLSHAVFLILVVKFSHEIIIHVFLITSTSQKEKQHGDADVKQSWVKTQCLFSLSTSPSKTWNGSLFINGNSLLLTWPLFVFPVRSACCGKVDRVNLNLNRRIGEELRNSEGRLAIHNLRLGAPFLVSPRPELLCKAKRYYLLTCDCLLASHGRVLRLVSVQKLCSQNLKSEIMNKIWLS